MTTEANLSSTPFDNSLLDAEYEGVRFPVDSLSVQGGHTSAKHRAYLRRGVDIEHTGQDGYSGTLNVPCTSTPALDAQYGEPMWPEHLRTLIDKFESTPYGELIHPTLGQLRVHIDSWPHKADTNNRSGVSLEVHWSEHNASATVGIAWTGTTITHSPEDADAQAAYVDSWVESAPVPYTGYASIASAWSAPLAVLQSTATVAYQDIVSALALMNAAVKGNLDLPAAASIEQADKVLAMERLYGVTASLRDQYLPDQASVRYYTTPTLMAAWQVAQAVYGNISLVELILAANTLDDPSAIRAGTVLTILPSR